MEANQNTAFDQKSSFKTKTQGRKAVWVNMGLFNAEAVNALSGKYTPLKKNQSRHINLWDVDGQS